MANNVLLETIELTQNASSVTFDNLPSSGYTDLKIIMSARGNGTTFGTNPWQNCSLTLNSTSPSAARQLYATAAGTGSDSNSSGVWITDPEATGGIFSNNEINILNYRSSAAKHVLVNNTTESNSADAARVLWSASYSSVTSAVTNITITPVSGVFLPESTFSLYAVAASGTTNTIAPFATGGNIVANDGTYWYHAFTSSGTFTPQLALTCDYLVVGGGGAGSRYGGGGAGGYRTASGSLTAINYAVTIGAGGASNDNNIQGSNGTSSIFSTTTSNGGGGGGSLGATGPGLAGASGGGGGSDGSYPGGAGNTPSTSPAQGFAGGSGNAAHPYYVGGGGGGATAVGANGSGFTGGDGGSGSNALSAWASATSTGVSGYYAGGGGGTGYNYPGTGVGGAGGAGGGGAGRSIGDGTQTPVPGVANTGGGGGGGWSSSYVGSNAGGSGIVIIRYAMV